MASKAFTETHRISVYYEPPNSTPKPRRFTEHLPQVSSCECINQAPFLMVISCFQPISKISTFFPPSTHLGSSPFLQNPQACPNFRKLGPFPKHYRPIEHYRRSGGSSFVSRALLPVDPWAPTIDSQSIASQLFAVSLFPYLGFLYFITKSGSAPKLTLFGFYFLLAFVGATIPAGIYAKVHYGTSLANVDWLHGGAEFLLTLTNLFIVLGLRDGLRKAKDKEKSSSKAD